MNMRHLASLRVIPDGPKLPTGTSGTINEMAVSVDLLWKGYSIFRSLSPNAPCDLVAIKDCRMFRIEVTQATRNKNGGLSFPHHNEDNYDVMALVTKDGHIHYRPDNLLV